MDYQWYPGHMTKARRMMQENIRLIDIVIELVDARIPLSSRNPDIDQLAQGKYRMILLNKSDMADDEITKGWEQHYKDKGFYVCQVNSRKGTGIREVKSLIRDALKEKKERDKKRGILNRPIRAMVVGIPNVGKSTFINSFVGRASAKTGNKPGVTKGKQWIKIGRDIELLDTPGILWPKFEDQKIGMRLALIGSIREEILNETEMAEYLIDFLKENYAGVLAGRYDVDEKEGAASLLSETALKRGCVRKGGGPDEARAAKMILDDFRAVRLGRISLENVLSDGGCEEEK